MARQTTAQTSIEVMEMLRHRIPLMLFVDLAYLAAGTAAVAQLPA
jgi:hypothetical protein